MDPANPPRGAAAPNPDLLSPGGKSRYGRMRRPKIAQDFYNTESVVMDENPPVRRSPSPLKAAKLKPVKIDREILFEIKDEFTKLDHLGMKVANNFKTNRGLDDTIKERKFFKSMPEARVEIPNVVDVTKVFKLISKPAVISNMYEKKAPPKSSLKTYSNKRRHVHDSDSFVVESFGLPDEPIIPVNSPLALQRDTQIDIDLTIPHDVNIDNPWIFDEYQSGPLFMTDPVTTMEEFTESRFGKSSTLDLFCYDSLLSENTESEATPLCVEETQNEQLETDEITITRDNSNAVQTPTRPDVEITKSNTVETPKATPPRPDIEITKVKCPEKFRDVHTRKSKKDNTKNTEVLPCCRDPDIVITKTKKTVTRNDKKCDFVINLDSDSDDEKNTVKSDDIQCTKVTVNCGEKKVKTSRVVVKKKSKLPERRRILRSNNESIVATDIEITKEILTDNVEKKQRSSSHHNHNAVKTPLKQTKIAKPLINPVNYGKIICNSQVRVILNPLAIKGLPDGKTFVPNPFKIKRKNTSSSLKQKQKLRSFKPALQNVTEKVVGIKKNMLKKNAKKEAEVKYEDVDVKNIKPEIIDYNVGDLTWAKIGTHPYWPCMITQEPISGDHKKNIINRSQPLYHVRFFGDKGRRSWVSSNRIMLYCGKDDLEKLANVLKVEGQVKSSFIKESYIIKPAKLPKWQSGVDEAETLKSKSVNERLNYFFQVFATQREKRQREREAEIKGEVLDEILGTDVSKKRPLDEQEGIETKKAKSERKKDRDGSPEKSKKEEAPKKSRKNKLETTLSTNIFKKSKKDESLEERTARKFNRKGENAEEKKSGEVVSPLKKGVRKSQEGSPRKTTKKTEDSGREEASSSSKKVDKKPSEKSAGEASSPKKAAKKTVEEETEPTKNNSKQVRTGKRHSKREKDDKAKEELAETSPQDARKRLRNFQPKEEEKKAKTDESLEFELPKTPKRISTEESLQEGEDGEEPSVPKLRNKRSLVPCESDTDSKFSDNSSVPTSLESQAALYRRNNIFRGIPKEKVCQICEKLGEVFKCKGPCSGVFHYNCAMSAETKDENGEKAEKGEGEAVKSNVEIIAVNSKKPLPNLSPSPQFKGMSLAEKIDYRMKEIMKKFDYQSVYSESTDSSSEEFIMDESFEASPGKPKTQTKLALTVTSKPSSKEVPIIKHVTADNINYICVTNERPKDKEVTELIKDTLKHLRCTWCSSGEVSKCLVCGNEESKLGSKFRQKCSLHQCGKYYHPECLKAWPQTQWSLIHSTRDKKSDASYDTFVCPRHVCHTCISDDPRAANSRCPSDKVVKCLRCPATYHSSNYCVPAGTHILSTSQIVCPRHYTNQKSKKRNFQQTINTNWCFICSKGGNLICCETCPTSVHVECMPGDPNEDDTFFCEDCQSGRLPLYDEIVWVKLGTFRWWPALILFPNEVPDNVKHIVHNKGEFVVKFFGTYDHYWVGRGRTFLFQEGDKGHSNPIRKRVDSAFVKAIEEAAAAHRLKKQFKVSKVAEKNSGLKPPPYIRIKVNKPVGNVRQFDGNTSNTTSCECDPNQPHPCGPDSDCLNRLLLTECNPEVCPAGERCNNQCFEKREYPPLVPHRTQVRGWGLKTLAPIRKGQFVIEYVGEMIDEQEYQRRVQKMHEQKEENYYFLTIDKDRMLDAGPKGNVARFMNHSCQPNCETQKWTVNGDTRVGLFAHCDIPADTELTFNYNLECIGKEKKICKCGAPNCSGFIGVKVKPDGPSKKSIKQKKKKSTPPPPPEASFKENPCFVCGKVGDVAACNNKICTKYYHLECVGLKTWPEGGKWVCQWHNCNFCSKRTIRCCVKCLNSFCPPHSEGNVRYDKLLGFVCTEHDPTKESNEVVVIRNSPKPSSTESTEESAVTSTTSEETTTKPDDAENDFVDSLSLKLRLNGWMTSTPLKKSAEESAVSSASAPESKSKLKKSKKKKKKINKKKTTVSKVQVKNTANLYSSTQNEVKLSNFTPVKYLRTSRSSSKVSDNRTDPDKDLPIRKRTRLRCGNSL